MNKSIVLWICVILFCLSAAPAIGAPGYYEQLDLIAENASLWKQTEVFGLWGYAVTDLDQNGRLEIISASVQGTGFYTLILIYEVNEAGNGLTEIRQAREEFASSPDIIVDSVPVYFDPESGVYYYIFDDMIRNGYAEVYENKRAVFLKDGVWNEIPLASKATLYTDAEHYSISFTDPGGAPISGDQYNSAADAMFGTLEKTDFCFGWNMTEPDNFALLDRESIAGTLRDSSSPVCPRP